MCGLRFNIGGLMASFNKVILLGNLTRDIELRYLPNGTPVCDLGVAVNDKYTDKKSGEKREEVTFVDVTLFGRLAEIAKEYLRKGSPALIEGRLKQETWADRETGRQRSRMKVVGETLQLLGTRDRSSGGSSAGGSEGSSAGAESGRENAVDGYASEDTPF